jgi:hypothetical protein
MLPSSFVTACIPSPRASTRWATILLLAVVTGSASDASRPQQGAASATTPRTTAGTPLTAEQRTDFLASPFEVQLCETTSVVIAALGPPSRRKTKHQRNRHQPRQMDDVITLSYQGLEFVAYKTNPLDGESKEIHLRTTVTAARYPVKYGLGVGASSDQVSLRLGTPTKQGSAVWIYQTDSFTRLELYIRDRRVWKVQVLSFPD